MFTFVVVLFSFIYLYELVIYDCLYSVLAMVPNKTFELELGRPVHPFGIAGGGKSFWDKELGPEPEIEWSILAHAPA